jgi:hypothetical protein
LNTRASSIARRTKGRATSIVLVAIVKNRLDLDASLYTLLQILSLTLFEKMPILQALSQEPPRPEQEQDGNQLNLFES